MRALVRNKCSFNTSGGNSSCFSTHNGKTRQKWIVRCAANTPLRTWSYYSTESEIRHRISHNFYHSESTAAGASGMLFASRIGFPLRRAPEPASPLMRFSVIVGENGMLIDPQYGNIDDPGSLGLLSFNRERKARVPRRANVSARGVSVVTRHEGNFTRLHCYAVVLDRNASRNPSGYF